MPETDQFSGQEQDAMIWVGLQAFRELSDWMMAAFTNEVKVVKPAMGDSALPVSQSADPKIGKG